MQLRWYIGIVGVGAAAILAAALFVYLPQSVEAPMGRTITPERTITLDSTSIAIAIADTAEERTAGLSGVSGLTENEGMLFVFEQEGQYSFWMKDMLFAIDMLWISSSGRVVHIEKSVSPETFPTAFTSSSPAQYVLEVGAGFSDAHGIREGSTVVF